MCMNGKLWGATALGLLVAGCSGAVESAALCPSSPQYGGGLPSLDRAVSWSRRRSGSAGDV